MRLNLPGLPSIVQQAFDILLNKNVGFDNLGKDVTDKLEEVNTKANTPHGNEAHDPEFETPTGAQAKVDAAVAKLIVSNWTAHAAAEANVWAAVTWSPELELFVAVATSGTNRVMTSLAFK